MAMMLGQWTRIQWDTDVETLTDIYTKHRRAETIEAAMIAYGIASERNRTRLRRVVFIMLEFAELKSRWTDGAKLIMWDNGVVHLRV